MSRFELKTPPNMLESRHTSFADEWVMRITADRRIEVNEGVEVNDAAKKVLEAMQHMLTQQRKPWVSLSDDVIVKCIAFDSTGFIKPVATYRNIDAELRKLNEVK